MPHRRRKRHNNGCPDCCHGDKKMNAPSKEEAKQAWTERNNRGRGFDPCGGDDINNLAGCGAMVNRSKDTSDVAIYEYGDSWIIVGDAHGPWATQVGKDYFGQYEEPHNQIHR